MVEIDQTVETGELLAEINPAADAVSPPVVEETSVVEIKVPEFGAESITEGTLMEWQCEVGDFVDKNAVIAVIETDKVSVDVTSRVAGTVEKLLVDLESTVQVNDPVATIVPGGAPSVEASPSEPAKESKIPPKKTTDAPKKAPPVPQKTRAGDSMGKGDILAIIETDKVSVDVTAPEDGVLEKIMVEIDQTVETGELLAEINPAADAVSPPVVEETSVVEIKVPEFGAESSTEGTLMEWQCEVGDFVDKNAVIAVIETDKVSVDVTSRVAGTVEKLLVDLESTVQVNDPVATIVPGGAPSVEASPSEPAKESKIPPKKTTDAPKKAPPVP